MSRDPSLPARRDKAIDEAEALLAWLPPMGSATAIEIATRATASATLALAIQAKIDGEKP